MFNNKIPPDIKLSLVGIIIEDGTCYKFRTYRDSVDGFTFDITNDKQQTFSIGSGGEILLEMIGSESTSSAEIQTEVRHQNVVLGDLYRRYYAAQAIGDRRALDHKFGGALICIYEENGELRWQPSTSIRSVWRTSGRGRDARFSLLRHFQHIDILDGTLRLLHTDPRNQNTLNVTTIKNSLSSSEEFSEQEILRQISFRSRWSVQYLLLDTSGKNEPYALLPSTLDSNLFHETRDDTGVLVNIRPFDKFNYSETIFVDENSVYTGQDAVPYYLDQMIKDYDSAGTNDERTKNYRDIADFRLSITNQDKYYLQSVIGLRMLYKLDKGEETDSPDELKEFLSQIEHPCISHVAQRAKIISAIDSYSNEGDWRTVLSYKCQHCKKIHSHERLLENGERSWVFPEGLKIKGIGMRVFALLCNYCGMETGETKDL